MLHVILHILAIIGIILLCILGLLLVLLLLVLFVPVRYKVKGNKDDSGLRLSVRVSYLLHILSARFDYPEPGTLIIRLFGIRIFDSGKEKKEAGGEEEEESMGAGESATVQESADPKKETAVSEDPDTGADEAAGAGQEEAETGQEAVGAGTEAVEEAETKEEKISFLRHPIKWIKSLIQKIKDLIRKIRYTILSIYGKIKDILENVAYYRDMLTSVENQRLYSRVWSRVLTVLKSIRPRVLKADLKIGTGSPDTTGYLLALYGMLFPILGNNVNIEADFEEAVFCGSFYAKGRITVFTVLLQAGKIFFDKQLRVFIKQLKREEA